MVNNSGKINSNYLKRMLVFVSNYCNIIILYHEFQVHKVKVMKLHILLKDTRVQSNQHFIMFLLVYHIMLVMVY